MWCGWTRVRLGVLGGEKGDGQATVRSKEHVSLLPPGPVTPGVRERKPPQLGREEEAVPLGKGRGQLDSKKKRKGTLTEKVEDRGFAAH